MRFVHGKRSSRLGRVKMKDKTIEGNAIYKDITNKQITYFQGDF